MNFLHLLKKKNVFLLSGPTTKKNTFFMCVFPKLASQINKPLFHSMLFKPFPKYIYIYMYKNEGIVGTKNLKIDGGK